MNQAQVNSATSLGSTDQQMLASGATVEQLAAIPPSVRPIAHAAGHAAQAHANVHVAGGLSNNRPEPPQILMAQQAQQPVLQYMGVGLPVHVGGAAFRLTTMPLWAYVLVGMFMTLIVWLAVAGWTRPAGASVITLPAVSAPVVSASAVAAQPQAVKIDPIKIIIDVQGLPGKP